jgi:uncharacterized protein YydD (DUF2326 family)
MIHSIHSTLPSFKGQDLKPGLNVLLAGKSKGASDRQTRNRAGKSSLIEVVHFVLGADVDKKSLFKVEALANHRYGMTFELAGQNITAERDAKSPTKVLLKDADTAGWPIQPDKATGLLSNNDWNALLGHFMFGLSVDAKAEKRMPYFRTLFPYFVRRQSAQGFLAPEKHTEKQQLGAQQIALSHLLGLDTGIAIEWEQTRQRKKGIKAMEQATKAGVLRSVVGTNEDLSSSLVIATDALEKLRKELHAFNVLPEYTNIEQEASQLTKEINELADANTMDRKMVLDLKEALARETPPPTADLERLYKEVGVVLAGSAMKRFEEVQAFHDSVIANRRDYLGGELTAAEQRIRDRERRMGDHDRRRAELMEILRTHGALEQYDLLRSELSKLEAKVEALKKRQQATEQLRTEKTAMEIERKTLLQRLRADLKEREAFKNEAILAFEHTSQALYEQAGHLRILDTENGLQLKIEVPGSRSKGISNMQIFCFDMMLMRLCAKRGTGPGFLIHDSHLFDGVDARQVAHALEAGAKAAAEFGFQYIVTLNSDTVSTELKEVFDPTPYVIDTRMSDARDDGGLFGIRFE